jgi:hypothetical protein
MLYQAVATCCAVLSRVCAHRCGISRKASAGMRTPSSHRTAGCCPHDMAVCVCAVLCCAVLCCAVPCVPTGVASAEKPVLV